jgi:N utilization substance protein B
MLNRRLLRSKAVQALYASRIATDANRLLAMDEITEAYMPDLNSMLPQNREQLEAHKVLGLRVLDNLIKDSKPSDSEPIPQEVLQTARRVFESFKRQSEKDRKLILNRVLKETEAITQEFITVLTLLAELSNQAKLERERIYKNPEMSYPFNSGLDDNSVIKKLEAHEPFELEVIRYGISWANDLSIVRKTYREALRTDEEYIRYCEQLTHTPEEDQKIVQHILRQIILKHEIPLTFFQQSNLYWEDHFDLIKSLSVKTLKSANSEAFQLAQLTDDWDDDQFFVEELFQKAVEYDAEYEGYLSEQLKNWDVERIALVDMIILKAALTELIHFPGIPVKVTINEFIEIAKRYSTLKSGKFVNGNLDKLVEKLTEKGIIRKSGRGLIDNK